MKRLALIIYLFINSPVFSQLQTDSAVIFTLVDEQAEYPGDLIALMKFIHTHLDFPVEDLDPGCIPFYLKFVVYEDGTVHEAKLFMKRQERGEWNKVAERLVNQMPLWKPAKIKGKSVKCYYDLPMRIRIM